MGTLDRIIELLKENKKKQIDLCKYLGVKKNAFTSWKNGANHSYLKYISEIAEFFNVSTDYLLGKTDQKEKLPGIEEWTMFNMEGVDGAQTINLNLNNLEQLNNLINISRDLPPEKIEAIIRLIETMK